MRAYGAGAQEQCFRNLISGFAFSQRHELLFEFERIQKSLAAANIKASTGIASRNPSHGLESALKEANQNMYKAKRVRQ